MGDSQALVIRNGTLVPLTERRLWHAGDVLVEQGRIAAVGTVPSSPGNCRELDATGCLVLPGFVQAHVHVVQSLARYRAEGLPLLRWLGERIWPYEASLTADDVTAAAELGVAELLASGTTAALDMGGAHHHDRVFAAAADLGIRLVSGKTLMDTGQEVPEELLEPAAEALQESARLGMRWHGAEGGRLRYAVAPRFVLSCSESLLLGAARLARQNGWMLHSHASENHEESARVRELTGKGNVAYLADLKLGGTDTVLAHCIHLADEEFALLAAQGTGVAHCPASNLKLGSGVADLPRMLREGIRVGLGADGPPCNNRLSIFREMFLAGALHNLSGGPAAVDPWAVLEMATWRGADVIGWGGEVGRLAPGWRGDLVVLRSETWGMAPRADPAVSVVFGGDDSVVHHVVVDGRVVVEDGRLRSGDDHAILSRARAAATDLDQRAVWT